MSILMVVGAAMALGLVPAALDRLAPRISPRLLARFDVAAITASSTAMTAAMMLLAAPPAFRVLDLHTLARVCDRLLFHLGVGLPPSVGWAGPAGLLWITIRVGASTVRSMRYERVLCSVAGIRVTAGDVPYPVLYADLNRSTAFSLGGSDGMIVISRGLADVLDESEMSVVLQHEAAHLQHGHGSMLRVLAALESAFGRLPGFRASIDSARLAIERWADEAALEASGCDRNVATSALLKATGVVPSATPSLSNVDSIVRRLRALADSPSPTRAWPGLLVGAGLLTIGGLAVAGFYTWVSHGHTALALAGWCPV